MSTGGGRERGQREKRRARESDSKAVHSCQNSKGKPNFWAWPISLSSVLSQTLYLSCCVQSCHGSSPTGLHEPPNTLRTPICKPLAGKAPRLSRKAEIYIWQLALKTISLIPHALLPGRLVEWFNKQVGYRQTDPILSRWADYAQGWVQRVRRDTGILDCLDLSPARALPVAVTYSFLTTIATVFYHIQVRDLLSYSGKLRVLVSYFVFQTVT